MVSRTTNPPTPAVASVRNEEFVSSEVPGATARELLRQPEKLVVTSKLPPFWSTKRGRAIMVLIVLVVIGAIVGGAIGGAKGNGGPDRNNPGTAPSPPGSRGRTPADSSRTRRPRPSTADPIVSDTSSNDAEISLSPSPDPFPPLITTPPLPRKLVIRHATGIYDAESILAYATPAPSR
ncbi:hypothetical protein CVT24_005170 [Panaeolus cyanescens]|uniref:Uncharacterized protein n=1 Tax=Panaeolus cyanescens TaxID=181874 RepID=A0A409Y9N8_9AGAR|nr:hypothetical protein CVT24_005170 [Panaeolus cyanescens]